MRNLCVVTQSVQQCRAHGDDARFALAFDGSGFVAFDAGHVHFERDRHLDLSCVGLSAEDRCVGLVALDDGSAVVALSSGALISTDGTAAEAVGHVEQGLVALSASPDQEVLVLGTGGNTLVFMTREFDPVCEVALDQVTATTRISDKPPSEHFTCYRVKIIAANALITVKI
jgi:elongator complex protein 1